MKRPRLFRPWPLALLTGLLLVFGWVWSLEVTVPPTTDAQSIEAILQARSAVVAEGRAIADRLARDRWVREVVPRVVADHRAGLPLSMGWPEGRGLTSAQADSITSVLMQPDLVPLTEEPAAIGLHVTDELETSQLSPGPVTLIGEHEGTAYCVRAGVHPDDYFLRWARRRHIDPAASGDLSSVYRIDLLGTCTFVRRFGMPGPHIRAWLGARTSGEGSLDALVSGGYSVRRDRTDGTVDALDVAAILTGEFLRGGIHVIRRACRDGDRAACMREFFPTGEPPTATDGPTVVEERRYMFVTGVLNDLSGALEAEFGSEAFAAFWTSDAPLELAFESAFGLHPADWVYRTATDLDGPLRAGPAPGVGAIGTSVLLMLAGLAVGVLAAIRRRTG